MKKLILLAIGCVSIGSAIAGSIPAATEVPLVSNSELSVAPGEAKRLAFTFTKSADQSPFGDGARRLQGCVLEGTVKLGQDTSRIMISDATVLCKKGSLKAQSFTGGGVDGQLIGVDDRTGLSVQCKGAPQCLVGVLRKGTQGKFLFTKSAL
jgi:hypothetical protein